MSNCRKGLLNAYFYISNCKKAVKFAIFPFKILAHVYLFKKR